MALNSCITGALIAFTLIASITECSSVRVDRVNQKAFVYPTARRNESVANNYHGTNVIDPYRWLENPDTDEVKQFVRDQNDLTKPYLENCHFRDEIRDRLSAIWNYRKSDPPQKHGDKYFQYANNGLQNQNVLYIQDALDGSETNRRVFLDPNTLSENGTKALTTTQSFSKDGFVFAYGISTSGSDWRTIYFRNVSTGQDLPDILYKVKFTDIVWKENEGIFYGHYPDFEGDPEGSDTGTNENQTISYHKLGTSQEEDRLVVSFPDKPKLIIASGMTITSEGTHLIVTPEAGDGEGSYGDNTVYYVDLTADPNDWIKTPLVDVFNASYRFITDDKRVFYFLTNLNATKYRIVTVDIDKPHEWITLVEEDKNNVLNWAAPIHREYILLNYLENVASKLVLRKLAQNDTFSHTFDIEIGSVKSFSGSRGDAQLFIKFESFLVPNRIYVLNFTTPIDEIKLEIFEDVQIEGLDPSKYTVQQIKYGSKDNVPIPMFIIHKNETEKNGSAPAMLYGYGGFNINILPEFSVRRIVFMQSFDGVVAVANIRGGGEYGNEWHKGGSLLNKQNVFDDFQAAADYLIKQNYTSAEKMIIEGRSNGGLLVGACVNQRPDLFGAAIASVGVMDMLRYHLFTIGHSWVSEYGSSDDPVHFENIYGYSPLHNLKLPADSQIQYPAIIVTTSDHDDRVVPSHSYKYTAQLQYAVGRDNRQTNPLMLRIENEAGHGAGSPISKLIEEQVDILSFLTQSLDLAFEGQKGDGARFSSSVTAVALALTLFFVNDLI